MKETRTYTVKVDANVGRFLEDVARRQGTTPKRLISTLVTEQVVAVAQKVGAIEDVGVEDVA